MKAALAGGEHALLEMAMATHAGTTTEEFDRIVADWIATAKHPKTGRLYTEMVYQPMLELLAYLRANGFKTFIVSGGGIEFMRPWAERVYGIPPEQVVGSSIKTKFELRDGKPVLVRLPEINFVDDKAGKPVGIQMHIGRRPIAAFGNSDGDLQMLQWTAAGSGSRFCLYVHHTDAEREWAYDRQSLVGRLDKGLDEARAKGWTVVDMKTRLEADLPVQLGKVTMTKASRLLPAAIAAVLWLAGGTTARAQTEDILPPPVPGVEHAVPELVKEDLEVRSRWFTMHLGLVPIFDYTWFTQDQASFDQVGVQENDFDIRSARIMARGTIFAHSKHAPRYLVAFEYRGFDSDPDQTWNFTDVSLTFPLGRIGDLTVGKTKENFVYEMVGDAANLPHVERLMSPFFVSRNIGLRWNRTAAAERMTLSLGVYNDWLTTDPTWEDSGTTVAGRVTGLAWTDTSGRRFLHLAGAFRRNGADEGTGALQGPAGVERHRQLRGHRQHPGLARDPVRPRGAVERGAGLAHRGVRRVPRGLAGDRRPAVPGLVRDRRLGADRRAPPLRQEGRLRPARDPEGPLGSGGALRAVRARGPDRQGRRRRLPEEVVRRSKLVGQPAHPHQRGLWPRDAGQGRDDRPHQPVLHALAVGVLILTGVELMKNMKAFRAVGAALVLLAALPVSAQQAPAPSAPAADSAAELAKRLANPIANLISVPFQSNWDLGIGANNGSRMVLNIQPVVPFRLSDDWNLITRTIVPVASQFDLTGASTSESGLGDSVVTAFLSPSKGGITWGVGPAFLIPTATDDALGSGKLGIGPSVVALRQSGGWTVGGLANHLVSVAGSEDRGKVNATFLNPFLVYNWRSGAGVTLNVEYTRDWENDVDVLVVELPDLDRRDEVRLPDRELRRLATLPLRARDAAGLRPSCRRDPGLPEVDRTAVSFPG